MKETKDDAIIKKRLESTFGDKDDCYYVYALCDENNNAFYIGKGTGGRVLAHEKELEADIIEINKLDDAEEREKRLVEWSEKKKRIDELPNVKKIIIKYGLTEEEAFMAESALINMLKYSGVNLCNIVNGHASEKEKDSRAIEKTKARDLTTFIDECALDEITIDAIDPDVVTKAIFISFRTLAPHCKDDRDLYWDAVRGEWRMSKAEANKAKYVFAMSDSVIKAVFEVKPGEVKDILSGDNQKMPRRPDAKTIERETEYLLANRIAEVYKKHQGHSSVEESILKDKKCLNLWKKAFKAKNPKATDAVLRAELKKWINRRYFTDRVKDHEDELNAKYANKVLKEKKDNEYVDYMSPRGSIRYGKNML